MTVIVTCSSIPIEAAGSWVSGTCGHEPDWGSVVEMAVGGRTSLGDSWAHDLVLHRARLCFIREFQAGQRTILAVKESWVSCRLWRHCHSWHRLYFLPERRERGGSNCCCCNLTISASLIGNYTTKEPSILQVPLKFCVRMNQITNH